MDASLIPFDYGGRHRRLLAEVSDVHQWLADQREDDEWDDEAPDPFVDHLLHWAWLVKHAGLEQQPPHPETEQSEYDTDHVGDIGI